MIELGGFYFTCTQAQVILYGSEACSDKLVFLLCCSFFLLSDICIWPLIFLVLNLLLRFD